MAGQWQITATANAAAVTASTTAGTTGGNVIRLRSLQCTLGGTGAGSVTLVVRDGATGAGTIIWQGVIVTAAGTSSMLTKSGIDLRATSGTLTIETTASGGANTTSTVNATGDTCQQGAPYAGSQGI